MPQTFMKLYKKQSLVEIALIIALVSIIFLAFGDDLIASTISNFNKTIMPTNQIGYYETDITNNEFDKLEAKIQGPTTGIINTPITFTDASISIGECSPYIRSYPWSASNEYKKTFSTIGKHTITLKISGCNKTSTTNFIIDIGEDTPDVIDFSIQSEKTPIDDKTKVTIIGGHGYTGIVDDYEWKLNNTNMNWDNEIEQVFSEGTYNISYRGKQLGYETWSDWVTKSITVLRSNELPFGDEILVSGTKAINQNIEFSIKAGDPDNDNLNSVWQIYDKNNVLIKTFNNSGTSINENNYIKQFNMNNIFSQPGDYTIKVTINDNNNGKTIKTKTITIDDYVDYSKNYTSVGLYSWTVPYTGKYQIKLYGAQGGGPYGGKGGYIKGEINLTQNQVLKIYVGGKGGTTSDTRYSWASGGWNGGGKGYSDDNAGGGGGATDIRLNGTGLNNRIFVAGGGGGTGDKDGRTYGGTGGGLNGSSGKGSYGGGGSQYSGGNGDANNGSFGYGGSGSTRGSSEDAGGGGGGWYGGGSGYQKNGGGGGGSGYYNHSLFTNVEMKNGIKSNNGSVYIIRIK